MLILSETVAKRCSTKNFVTFTRKHLYQSLLFFFDKVIGLVTLLKKRLRYRCFPVNLPKFLKKPILYNICKRQFLLFMTLNKNFRTFTLNFDFVVLVSHRYKQSISTTSTRLTFVFYFSHLR